MSLRRNPPRSSRSSGISPSNLESEWFPDIKNPDSIVHQQINTLNCDAYPFEVFARADDLLMFMAFANKGKKCCHHSVLPEPAQSGNPMYLSKQEGALGANICKELFNGGEPSWEAVVQCVEALQQQISAFRSEDARWSACLSQYAHFSALPIHLSHFSISLLYRYSLIYSSGSRVRIRKVTHGHQKATFGLAATRMIPCGSYIMETCSSMSCDLASDSGPSIIEPAPRQLGPLGPRSILGPFRFINHDCGENAQVSFLPSLCQCPLYLVLTLPIQIFPILGTYACVMQATRDIAVSEEITVRYLQSGYYGDECLCSSCTHVDTSDLSVLKPNAQEQPDGFELYVEM